VALQKSKAKGTAYFINSTLLKETSRACILPLLEVMLMKLRYSRVIK
jgi:hypothetical protein